MLEWKKEHSCKISRMISYWNTVTGCPYQENEVTYSSILQVSLSAVAEQMWSSLLLKDIFCLTGDTAIYFGIV